VTARQKNPSLLTVPLPPLPWLASANNLSYYQHRRISIVGDHPGCLSPSLSQGTGASFIKRRMKPLIPLMHRSAAGPGLIIDYLIFDHFDSLIIGEAARQVGGW
jgi:hypothetical protein